MLLEFGIGLSIAVFLIPLILLILFLYQGNLTGAVVVGSLMLFGISPVLCLILLFLGILLSPVIGRQELSRVCLICLIVYLALYLVLVLAGVVGLAIIG